MYKDHPQPGKGYLAFIYFFVALFIFLYVFMFFKIGDNVAKLIFVIVPALLPLGVMWAIIHAAYHTEYRLENDVLMATSGLFFKEKIPLNKIDSMREIRFIKRVIGWGFNDKGVCNRFKNGVLIRAGRERLYISPTNCCLFIDKINGFRNALKSDGA